MPAPARPSTPTPLTPTQQQTLEKVVVELVLNIELIASNFKSRGSAAEAEIKKVLKANKENTVAQALQQLLKPLLNSAKQANTVTKTMAKVFGEYSKKKTTYVKLKAEIDKAEREQRGVVIYADAFMAKGKLAKSYGVGVSSVLAMCEVFPKKAEITFQLIDKLPAK